MNNRLYYNGKYLVIASSLVAHLVVCLQGRRPGFSFLGRKDSLEKEMATHSSILAWRISWTEKPGRLQSMESEELDMT